MTTPSPDSALILPVALPPGLEAMRLRGVADAAVGLPAHVTLLYPFAPVDVLDAAAGSVAAIVARHRPFAFRLVERRVWPGVVYVSVEPGLPFVALYRDLAAAFPEYPLHDGAVAFVPHVTIVEGDAEAAHGAPDAAAWRDLPASARADALELIVRREGRWTGVRTFALTGAP